MISYDTCLSLSVWRKRQGFNPWVGKILWRRKWQPSLVFLPGRSHGQRSLAGYSPWRRKELDIDWATEHSTCINRYINTESFPGTLDRKINCLQCWRPGFSPWIGKIPQRRKQQPAPVLVPGKFHGWRNLVGYSAWGHRESDTTEWLRFHFSFMYTDCLNTELNELLISYTCTHKVHSSTGIVTVLWFRKRSEFILSITFSQCLQKEEKCSKFLLEVNPQ